jgi:EF hand
VRSLTTELLVFLAAVTLTSASFAQTQLADFTRASMRFSARAMDTNGDGMISMDEFMRYEATHWSLLAKDASGQIALTDMQKHRQQAASAAAAKSK